jgi:DNA-directed RNA polymerase specialized sigma24 family protein
VYRLALSILDDPSEAEDATQESLLSALRALDTFHGGASLKTWLLLDYRQSLPDPPSASQ